MRATSQTGTQERTRRHFRAKAWSFDRLYDEESRIQRLLRPALFHRRELAVSVVAASPGAEVLDVGCGSGRVAEHLLEAGAGRYVGVDFSAPMLDLARHRLERFADKVELVEADFLTTPLNGPFDVIVALGLFDYTPEPYAFTRRMFELSSGVVVASFPSWTWFRGPIRKVRYEIINDVSIFNYTRRELEFLFRASGFSRLEIIPSGRAVLLAKAYR
jgi:SAM-dependent methyltransferase